MDDCGHAIHDFHHDTHDFSHSLGSFIDHHTGHDHGQDTGWGHMVESGLNSGSSWLEMNKACDSNVGVNTSTPDTSSTSTGW